MCTHTTWYKRLLTCGMLPSIALFLLATINGERWTYYEWRVDKVSTLTDAAMIQNAIIAAL